MYKFEKFEIAHAALVAITFILSFVLFWCALCLARRRKDPARTAFTYLKVALLTFTIFVFLDAIGYGLSIAYSEIGSPYYYNDDLRRALLYAQSAVMTVARVYDCFTQILIFIILLRLATGIIIAQTGQTDAIGKITRLASYGAAAVLIALTIAQFALRIKFYVRYYGDFAGASQLEMPNYVFKDFTTARQIDFSFRVLVFVIALAVIARAVTVKLQSKGEPALATPGNFLLVVSTLYLLATVYYVASTAASDNLSDATKDPTYKEYFDITDWVFFILPTFLILLMVFILGQNKAKGGLWSSGQQQHVPALPVNPNDPTTTWGYNNQAPANVPPPVVQQQQQQPPMQTGWQPQPVPQQQGYYAPQPQQQQHGFQPQDAYMAQLQQDRQSQSVSPHYSQYSHVSPTNTSPPPMEEAMGLNHQADGTPPHHNPSPYAVEKY